MRGLSLIQKKGEPLKVLFLGAHSDDIEIGCGGTVLSLLEEGQELEVWWVVFAASPERRVEAEKSAAMFLRGTVKKEIIIRDFKESFFPYIGSEIKAYFEELKRTVNPDVAFTHFRDDLHQDHRILGELVWNTFRNHLLLQYEIPKYEGDLGTPNLFVPLSRSVADRKVELLLHHFASQGGRSWFKPDTFHGLMSIRGIECNAPEGRAEAFYVRKVVL